MTAFHLAHDGGPTEAMDALRQPAALRSPSDAIAPFPEPDPYMQRLTIDDVRAAVDVLRSAASV